MTTSRSRFLSALSAISLTTAVLAPVAIGAPLSSSGSTTPTGSLTISGSSGSSVLHDLTETQIQSILTEHHIPGHRSSTAPAAPSTAMPSASPGRTRALW